MALALLGLGEAAPGAWPVEVSIEGHGTALEVTVEGQSHAVVAAIGPGWRGIRLEQPGPVEREYQVDGSDTTSTGDRQPAVIVDLADTWLYGFDAWLRDEGGYSRWERISLVDLRDSQTLAAGAPLPDAFRIDAVVSRPEAAAHLWLLGPPGSREGLELDRDRRNARWVIEQGGTSQALPRWFFPERPWPFVAELLHLQGRAAVAGAALLAAAIALGWLTRSVGARVAVIGNPLRGRTVPPLEEPLGAADVAATRLARDAPRKRLPVSRAMAPGSAVGDRLSAFANGILAGWLLAAALVATRLYHQLPHILDAVSYTFQAGLFAAGRLALEPPQVATSFRGPFEVAWHGKLFSQYPPGAPAAYAVGQVLSLEWLVGPFACLALIAATGWAAAALFGPTCGLVVVALGALSPFVLFQAGSYLSHPIAAGLLGAALAAFVKAERAGQQRWYAIAGVLLGLGFLTREVASVLFALPLGVRLATTRRFNPALTLAVWGLPFVLVYLLYNVAQTGSAGLLPRALFDPSDHFGFGDGIGFHTRHTLAAGLANTDELLTLLQFDLFGWPPLFALGLLGVPWLGRRALAWDWLAALGALAFVVTYVGYFYHGVALGPRYYFEAMPWLLLLTGRGVQVLAQAARSRTAVAIVLTLLSLNAVLVYLPREVQRRMDLSAQPGGRKVSLGFVQTGLFGAHLDNVAAGSLVITSDWWLFNTSLAALNCGRAPDCDVLFALATTPADEAALRAAYPRRALLRTRDVDGRIDLVPWRARS